MWKATIVTRSLLLRKRCHLIVMFWSHFRPGRHFFVIFLRHFRPGSEGRLHSHAWPPNWMLHRYTHTSAVVGRGALVVWGLMRNVQWQCLTVSGRMFVKYGSSQTTGQRSSTPSPSDNLTNRASSASDVTSKCVIDFILRLFLCKGSNAGNIDCNPSSRQQVL